MVRLIGVLNLTPDSFSDGGRFKGCADAIEAAHGMVEEGAWAIDVGGESTRPGARQVPAEVQLARILPVVRELAASGVRVSVDTMDAHVAYVCMAVGASMINDVSGGLHDENMLGVAASSRGMFVASHWRGRSEIMASRALYSNVTAEVRSELESRIACALQAGISESNLVVDPGIGFAKDGRQSWEVLGQLERIVMLGYPVMVGTSRKSLFLEVERRLGNDGDILSRDDLTATSSALAVCAGASYLRVHNVLASRRAVGVALEWLREDIDGSRSARHRRMVTIDAGASGEEA